MGLGSWLSPRTSERGSASGGGLRFTTWDSVTAATREIGWIDRARASGLPGVGRGVELVADVIGSLAPEAVKHVDDPAEPIEVLDRPQVLRDPDPLWHGRSTWLAALVRDVQWDGNGFADKTEDVDRLGYPTRLPLVPPSAVTWERTESVPAGAYMVQSPSGRQRREMAPSELMHAAVAVDSGNRMGRGILHTYQDALRLIAVVERATYVLMRDGKPAGLISTDVDMTAEELLQVKTGFIDGVRRDGLGALVRASFDKMSWSAADLALIPAREHNLRIAADITKVPGYLLGVPAESRVYSNMETEWSNFVKTTITRYLNPLQDTLSDCVPRGQVVRFNTDDLARPDAATRWLNHKIAVEMGAMTREEVRQAERMGPMPAEGAA